MPSDQDEITLGQLFDLLWQERWLILAVTLAFALAAGLVSWLVPKSYRASIVVSPVSDTQGGGRLGGLNSVASQFGGLASLAGISIGGDSKKSETLAVLQSEALTQGYIEKNDLLPVLYRKKWDEAGKRWKNTNPADMPTVWKAGEYWKKKIRGVSIDNKTDIVTLTITWKDPKVATDWANGLVKMANDYLREKAIAESERNIAYLTEQALKTDILGVKQAIYAILQTEISKAMLARGSEEYALKVLDPAIAPEKPSSPSALKWILGGFFGGFAVSVLVAFSRNPKGSRQDTRFGPSELRPAHAPQ